MKHSRFKRLRVYVNGVKGATWSRIFLGLLAATAVAVVSFRYTDIAQHAQAANVRVEQQQMWNAGCSDDNARLQTWVIELERMQKEHEQFDIALAIECAKMKRDEGAGL